MDIKVKGTEKVGILAYDLSDHYAKEEMIKAQRVIKIAIALSEFMNALRSIRKYDNVPDVRGMFDDRGMDAVKSEIMVSEDYYRALMIQYLEDNDCLDFLD
jgi:hypothetical protein